MLDISMTVGLHNGFFVSLLESVALALKNDYALEDYLHQLKVFGPALIEGVFREFTDAFANFDGKTYPTATQAPLTVEKASQEIVLKAMKQSNLQAPISQEILNLMEAAIKDGHANHSLTSLMSQIYKKDED